MAKVLMLTQGTGGDLHPFINIGRGVRERGHSVTLITHCRFAAEVARAGLDFAPLDKPERVEEMKVFQTREGMNELLAKRGMTDPLVLAACMDIFNTIAELSGNEPTVVVSHENLVLVTRTSAERLGLPCISVYTAPYFWLKLPVVERLYIYDSSTINSYRAEVGLPPVHDWQAWVRRPDRILGLWPEWFESARHDGATKVTAVGFVSNPEFEAGELSPELEERLAAGKPPVLITHGTSRPYHPDFFTASIEACAMTGRRALVVTPFGDLLPERLPAGVWRYDYLPFASVLPHVAAVIHHGGIGTLHQSLAAAIPQLVLGFGFDRPDNGARVKRLGVGEYLPRVQWRPRKVAEALDRLMTPEVSARCREFALRQREAPDSASAACDLITSALAEAPHREITASQSPLTHIR